MKTTRVEWIEYLDIPEYMGYDIYEHLTPENWMLTRSGDVIGTGSNFWHGNTLTVACDDGVIRTINTNKVKHI